MVTTDIIKADRYTEDDIELLVLKGTTEIDKTNYKKNCYTDEEIYNMQYPWLPRRSHDEERIRIYIVNQ